MEFAKLIDKRLLSLTNDQFFADNVNSLVLGRLMNLFVIPMWMQDRVGTYKILTEVFKPIFKDNCSFVKTILCSSMFGEIMSKKLAQENEILKSKIKTI